MSSNQEQNSFEHCKSKNCDKCFRCHISRKESKHSRRCFMTGEYCSQQRNIQHRREKLREKNTVMAFVVMNFSDMSEVVYKWRIASFVESLSKYLYVHQDTNTLYCCASEKEVRKKKDDPQWELIESIQVIRADSAPSSNYVVCNNICQQMQMADLVIVDVSSQNPNVFYEFGMAVALGKLILPICYSESYYNRKVHKALKQNELYKDNLEHHMGCYPWRKKLFEHFGLQYKNKDSKTAYKEYGNVVNPEFKFDDKKYSRFPYHENNVGKMLYEKLKTTYNKAEPCRNTLVVYTMERFLNENDAGRCIVNFYHNITMKMKLEGCFCGERVGILGQDNVISESDKDVDKQFLFYDVGEIIQIGLNQATYSATERKIKTKDVLDTAAYIDEYDEKYELHRRRKDNIVRCVKEYIRNRGLLVYPRNPVYVSRIKDQFYRDLFKENDDKIHKKCYYDSYFCFYYVMLRTLCYTNELVVDISNNRDNCIQEMFWLGAAHGKDIYVITVSHEETQEERKKIEKGVELEERKIFDVAGLWKAVLHSNDTDGFYKQLELAQKGVENHSKLIVADADVYAEQMSSLIGINNKKKFDCEVEKLYKEKEQEEKRTLESYYRNRFWKTMLRYNQLHIYLPQQDGIDRRNKEPRVYMIRWDFDAVSELSNYLSKRMPIGEYRIVPIEGKDEHAKAALKQTKSVREASVSNFISVGESAQPLEQKITESIFAAIKNDETQTIHKNTGGFKNDYPKGSKGCSDIRYKGFEDMRNSEKGFFSQHPKIQCVGKECKRKKTDGDVYCAKADLKNKHCSLVGCSGHTEIAQVILWREEPKETGQHSLFRVALIGSSGPATMGASLVFVDEEQKRKCMSDWKNKDADKKEEFLLELQEVVRKKFMTAYMNLLDEKLKKYLEHEEELNDISKEQYILLVKCAVRAYLSTVLYRYFLPFLSERDMTCIHNGMYAFLDYMNAAGESPFATNFKDEAQKRVVTKETVEKVIEEIPKLLLSTMHSFKGLEAFYKVKVENGDADNNQKDTRKVLDIEILKKEDDEVDVRQVNCFFIEKCNE